MKAIFVVMSTTLTVGKIRPEKKIQACTGYEPMTSAMPEQCSTNCRSFSFFLQFCTCFMSRLVNEMYYNY